MRIYGSSMNSVSRMRGFNNPSHGNFPKDQTRLQITCYKVNLIKSSYLVSVRSYYLLFSYRLALRIFRGGAGLKTHPVCCDKVLAPLTSAPDLTLKDCGMEIYWTSQRYCNQASERDGSCVTVKPKSRSSSKRSQHARKGRLRYDIGWNGWVELEW